MTLVLAGLTHKIGGKPSETKAIPVPGEYKKILIISQDHIFICNILISHLLPKHLRLRFGDILRFP